MEICGGQTHTLIKFGIDRMLPPASHAGARPRLSGLRDAAGADRQGHRHRPAPGGDLHLLRRHAAGARLARPTCSASRPQGGDVRMVYSPLDAVKLAQKHPDRQVVFFAVGFETTAPANAMAVWQASQLGLDNFSILCSHVLVPPAMEAILGSPDNLVQGFLAAGHVCAVMGYWEYEPIGRDSIGTPIVVTGFEPLDLLQGIYMTLVQLEEGRWGVENQYVRAVTREGNLPAQKLMRAGLRGRATGQWRGIGVIPQSGYALRPEFAAFDAEQRFDVADITAAGIAASASPARSCRGCKKPHECSAFGSRCTPEHPLGAPDGLVRRRLRGLLPVSDDG